MTTVRNVPYPAMRSIAIRYGFITLISLIVYFLVMWQMDLVKYTSLRFVNYALVFAGMYFMLRAVRRQDNRNKTDYLPGMGVLYMFAAFVSISFGIFTFIVTILNPAFLPIVADSIPNGQNLSPLLAGFAIASELFLFSVIIAFAVLMLFKRDRVSNATKMPGNSEYSNRSY